MIASERKQHIVVPESLFPRRTNKMTNLLVDAGLRFDCVKVVMGNDLITTCVSALTHRNPVTFIIITNFRGSNDQMNISVTDAVQALRCIPAYKTVPILIVSDDGDLNLFQKAGINAWIHPAAADVAFVDVIQAVLPEARKTILQKTSGEKWRLFTDVPSM